MRVIKRGELPKDLFPMKLTCYKCKSELEVDQSDCRSGQYNETIVICPICKSYVDVPLK